MTRILDLSSDGTQLEDVPYQCIQFTTILFPGGEEHIRINLENIPKADDIDIVVRIRKSADIMVLLLAVNALQRAGYYELHLVMNYVPYARQDRIEVAGEPLSIEVMADLINSCNFRNVHIMDPHSLVTPALIKDCEVMEPAALVEYVIQGFGEEPFRIVSPDFGAAKKIDKLITEIGHPHPPVMAMKHRDVVTGMITRTEVLGPNLAGLPCVVVDDICDGGRTFIELAKVLKQKDCGALHLFVSHGIFSKGLQPLLDWYDYIWTTDSLHNVYALLAANPELKDRVKVLDILLLNSDDFGGDSLPEDQQ